MRTHSTYPLGSLCPMGAFCGASKQLQQQHQRSLTSDHRNECDNDEKVSTTVKITKIRHRHTASEQTFFSEKGANGLALYKPSISRKLNIYKHHKVTYDRTRDACTCAYRRRVGGVSSEATGSEDLAKKQAVNSVTQQQSLLGGRRIGKSQGTVSRASSERGQGSTG